jgi:hypothetical protein
MRRSQQNMGAESLVFTPRRLRPHQGKAWAILPPVPHHTELWTCPKCGRRFVSRNLWHASGDYSVEGFLEVPRGTFIRSV